MRNKPRGIPIIFEHWGEYEFTNFRRKPELTQQVQTIAELRE